MKRYGNSYKTAPRCVERILKWAGYKVRVRKEAGFKCGWDERYPYDHFRYRVTISKGGNSTWFYFWGSAAEYWEGGESSPGSMIGTWITDRQYGELDFEEFCSDLGYDTDSISAMRTWKACVRVMNKIDRMFSGRVFEALEHCAYNL